MLELPRLREAGGQTRPDVMTCPGPVHEHSLRMNAFPPTWLRGAWSTSMKTLPMWRD